MTEQAFPTDKDQVKEQNCGGKAPPQNERFQKFKFTSKEQRLSSTIKIDQTNFVRLSLLYADHYAQSIGPGYVKMCRQVQSSKSVAEAISQNPATAETDQAITVPKVRDSTPVMNADTTDSNFQSKKDLQTYCENNAIFFNNLVKLEKRMIPPQRKESSRVQFGGMMRRRGSVIDELYRSPERDEIEKFSGKLGREEVSHDFLTVPHNQTRDSNQKRSSWNSVHQKSRRWSQQENDRQIEAELQRGQPLESKKKAKNENARSDGRLSISKHRTDQFQIRLNKMLPVQEQEAIQGTTSMQPQNYRRDHEKSFEKKRPRMSLLTGKVNNFRDSAMTPTIFYSRDQQMLSDKKADKLMMTAQRSRIKPNRNDKSPQEDSDLNLEVQSSANSIAMRQSIHATSQCKLQRDECFSPLINLGKSMRRVLQRKLEAKGFNVEINTAVQNAAITSGEQDQSEMKPDQELVDFTMTASQNLNKTNGANSVNAAGLVNEIDSMSSEHGIQSNVYNDIKALQFFSMEPACRMTIGKQKMHLQLNQMQKSNSSGRDKSPLKHADGKQLKVGDSNSSPTSPLKREIRISCYPDQTGQSPSVRKALAVNLQEPRSAALRITTAIGKPNRNQQHTDILSSSTLYLGRKPSLLTSLKKRNKFQAGRVRVDSNEGSKISQQNSSINIQNHLLQVPNGANSNAETMNNMLTPECSANTPEKIVQSSRSQVSFNAKIEQLKENLNKASWEQKEDKEAELRYDRFLMLQGLSKRMKMFYKQDFGQGAIQKAVICDDSNFNLPQNDQDPIVQRFRRASIFLREDIDNASDSQGNQHSEGSGDTKEFRESDNSENSKHSKEYRGKGKQDQHHPPHAVHSKSNSQRKINEDHDCQATQQSYRMDWPSKINNGLLAATINANNNSKHYNQQNYPTTSQSSNFLSNYKFGASPQEALVVGKRPSTNHIKSKFHNLNDQNSISQASLSQGSQSADRAPQSQRSPTIKRSMSYSSSSLASSCDDKAKESKVKSRKSSDRKSPSDSLQVEAGRKHRSRHNSSEKDKTLSARPHQQHLPIEEATTSQLNSTRKGFKNPIKRQHSETTDAASQNSSNDLYKQALKKRMQNHPQTSAQMVLMSMEVDPGQLSESIASADNSTVLYSPKKNFMLHLKSISEQFESSEEGRDSSSMTNDNKLSQFIRGKNHAAQSFASPEHSIELDDVELDDFQDLKSSFIGGGNSTKEITQQVGPQRNLMAHRTHRSTTEVLQADYYLLNESLDKGRRPSSQTNVPDLDLSKIAGCTPRDDKTSGGSNNAAVHESYTTPKKRSSPKSSKKKRSRPSSRMSFSSSENSLESHVSLHVVSPSKTQDPSLIDEEGNAVMTKSLSLQQNPTSSADQVFQLDLHQHKNMQLAQQNVETGTYLGQIPIQQIASTKSAKQKINFSPENFKEKEHASLSPSVRAAKQQNAKSDFMQQNLNLNILEIKGSRASAQEFRIDSPNTALLKAQLSPEAAQFYSQKYSPEEESDSDSEENLSQLKKLFSESATKGDNLIKNLADDLYLSELYQTQSNVKRFITESNQGFQSPTKFSMFSGPSPLFRSNQKKNERMSQFGRSSFIAMQEAVSAGIAYNRLSLGERNFTSFNSSVNMRTSTSAAYRKAQKFSERRQSMSPPRKNQKSISPPLSVFLARSAQRSHERQTARQNRLSESQSQISWGQVAHNARSKSICPRSSSIPMNFQNHHPRPNQPIGHHQQQQLMYSTRQLNAKSHGATPQKPNQTYIGVRQMQQAPQTAVDLSDVNVPAFQPLSAVHQRLQQNDQELNIRLQLRMQGTNESLNQISIQAQPSSSASMPFQLTLKTKQCRSFNDANGGERGST